MEGCTFDIESTFDMEGFITKKPSIYGQFKLLARGLLAGSSSWAAQRDSGRRLLPEFLPNGPGALPGAAQHSVR
jgi:hypothetical protein